jgi:uncharacterized protein
MALTVYQSSVPTFERSLNAFLGILEKAEAHAKARKFDSAQYLAVRLSPDMFPFSRQVQTFCDHAKNGSFRLAGQTPPAIEDNEKTLADLEARIRTTLEILKSLDPASLEGAAERTIVFPVGQTRMKMPGADYLVHFVIPNFYFHLTTAYDILRASGVELGKRSFLGAVPEIAPA